MAVRRTLSINRPPRAQAAIGGMGIRPQLRTPAPRPAGQPQVAAPPQGTPTPFDANFEMQRGNAIKRRDDSLTTLEQQRLQGVKQFGFDDASDPFSNLAMLKKHFETAKRSSANSMAARGQLYSGAAQNAQNYAAEDFGQRQDATRKQYQSFLNSIEQRKAQAASDFNDTDVQLGYQRIQSSLDNRPDPTETQPPPRKAINGPGILRRRVGVIRGKTVRTR